TAVLTAQEIGKLVDKVEPGELARAKAQAKAGLFMGREAPLARAEYAASQILVFDRVLPPTELADRIDAVTAADLQRVGAHALAGPHAVAVLGPKKAGEAAGAFERAVGA